MLLPARDARGGVVKREMDKTTKTSIVVRPLLPFPLCVAMAGDLGVMGALTNDADRQHCSIHLRNPPRHIPPYPQVPATIPVRTNREIADRQTTLVILMEELAQKAATQ
jgi:hypothetical protein